MPDEFVMLPANPYAKYALPIEYLPSRDLRPRWGNTRPPIALLYDWFRGHAPAYHAFLEEMVRSLPALESIPRDFREEQLPEPAWFGVPFAPFDALALYTMVRLRRPTTYIEIGSGISTCFVAKAVRDHRLNTRIVSIDPEPRAKIDSVCDEIIREGLETCDLERFAQLRAGDILFFDGSHRSFMNSDVTVFMIDILPRLKPGVIVHMHDITLPWDYPDMFVNWYWNEQYILAAYMIAGREQMDPILPTAFICRDEQFAARLARPLIDFGDPHLNFGWRGGGSMWFTHRSNGLAASDAAETATAEGDPLRTSLAITAAAEQSTAQGSDAGDLARRIEKLRALAGPDLASMDLQQLTDEIRDILQDPTFEGLPLEQQFPMIERVHAIYTWSWHASGRSLIPVLERLFHRAVAMPGVALDATCLFYDLLYFLHWYAADGLDAMRGVADQVVKPFAAAIRARSVCGLPAIRRRPLGREPLRLGYLSQFARPGHPIGRFAEAVLGGLARHQPGTYRLFLYAWSEHDNALLTPLASLGVTVRRLDGGIMSQRIAAVADAVAEDAIDILITDTNAALPTVLFEQRVAPVQVFYQFGMPFWPVSIDAVFRVDNYEPQLVGFDPDICCTMGLGPWNVEALAPQVDPDRIAAERARFPAGARLIGCYGRLAKITPKYLEIAAELLARHGDAVIVIGGTGDATMIRQFIAERNLAGRLELVEAYVDGHVWGHLLEIFLDTSPQEGGLSAREVIAKGRPVVTIRGAWSEQDRIPMLVAEDATGYLDIASRLLQERQFYEAACAATRDFVASRLDDADYVANLDNAVRAVIARVRGEASQRDRDEAGARLAGWGRNQSEPTRRAHHNLALDRLVCRSILDEMRSSAPSRVAEVDFGPGSKPVEVAAVDDLLYLPTLHLQIWRDIIVPNEANIDADAFPELQKNIRSRAVKLTDPLDEIDVIKDQVCVLSNLYSNNFGHFFEEMYKITILEHSGFRGRYVLSPYGDRHSPSLPRFATEFLELLGIPDDRIMICRRPTVFQSACFTTHIEHAETIAYRNVFFELRAKLMNAATAIASGLGPRLFLNRSPPRILINPEEVHECVSRYGFTVVNMARLPVAEQIAAAHHADVLVGTHGSGMSHCIFLKERSTVVECFSPLFMDDFILDYCHNLKLRYFQIVATNRAGAPLAYKYGADVAINYHHLELVLKSLI